VKDQPPSTAPDAASVLKFVVPLVWKSKWLIAACTALAAVMAFALLASGKTEIWSGRAVMSIGLAPSSDFIIQKSGPATVPIETPRKVIARLSDPVFKEQILKQAAFGPATASLSRSMVASSLRAVALDKERDIAIELSAGSAADVQSALRSITTEIIARHTAMLNQQLKAVQDRIDQNTAKLADIEKKVGEYSNQELKPLPPRKWNEAPHSLATPILMGMILLNALQGQITSDFALKELSEPTVVRVEADNVVVTHRSIETLRASLLAGAGMLVAMIILTIVVNPATRSGGRLSRTDATDG
jgi:hypothetical protein